jgi:hypothetical protein
MTMSHDSFCNDYQWEEPTWPKTGYSSFLLATFVPGSTLGTIDSLLIVLNIE